MCMCVCNIYIYYMSIRSCDMEHVCIYTLCVGFTFLQVYAGTMYMGVFGSGSPKRHRLFSNCKYYLDTICDRAGYMSRAEQSLCSNKLVKKYIDKSGKARCSGIKPALKESAYLV